MNPYRVPILILVCTALVSACGGWRLQGQVSLPEDMQPLMIIADRADHRLLSALEERLRDNDIRLASSGGAATLNLRELSEGSRVLSISSSGRPAETELFTLAQYDLQRGGVTIAEDQEILLTRTIEWTETDILAQQEERKVIQEALQDELVRTLMQRIASAARSPAQDDQG